MNIGIGLTVHNRHKTATEIISYWKLNLPAGARFIVVDDGSALPFPGADYRFDQNVGIPAAKNKCLELLEDCNHIFLVDDDIFPVSSNWCKPYVESDLNHACYIFGRKELKRTEDYVSFEKPCGCLLYFKNICLQKAGGFDLNFEKYFYEHVELSRRIYNLDLTPAPYLDVPDHKGLFYSLDEFGEVQSSVTADRQRLLYKNEAYFKSQFNSTKFKPYK